MRERKGDWIQTYTGGRFWTMDPQPEDIRFDDIAGALGKLCRYGGHCIRFYSVAEHCVHVASQAADDLKLTALLHDASEGLGLVDMPKPVKRFLPGYAQAEVALERAVALRFGTKWPLPAEVKDLDNRILRDECEQNMAWTYEEWARAAPLGVTLRFWPPAQATYEFTKAFYAYGGKP